MDRRKALQNMGLSLGYVVATPTLISIVQGCKTENELKWIPEFFSKEEGSVITHLVDIFLPKTDTPAASEIQVDIFVDRFIDQVMDKKGQELFKLGMSKFIEKALADTGKENAADLVSEDLKSILGPTLRISKGAQKTNEVVLENYKGALEEGAEGKLDDKVAQYAFAKNLRGLTVLGYKTSEFVGKQVLEYLPVPGEYVPCGNTKELTGGKAWSL